MNNDQTAMLKNEQLETLIFSKKVYFRCKENVWFYKFILRPLFYIFTFGKVDYLARYWGAFGDRIYYPNTANPEEFVTVNMAPGSWRSSRNLEPYEAPILHELCHIKQQCRLNKWWWLFLYVLAPLPIGLSYFRWKFEREAYLFSIKTDIQRRNVTTNLGKLAAIEGVVTSLSGYAWPWPKKWMRRWFTQKIGVRYYE